MIFFLLLFSLAAAEPQSFSRSSFGSFSSFGTPGRDFSNFVDLPSQRLQASQPQASQGQDGDCALLIPGYEFCITYSSIETAFNNARQTLRANLKSQYEEFDKNDIHDTAEVVTEVVRILAETYGLTRDILYDSLALADISRTGIGSYCPARLFPGSCELSRYRDIEGKCNNLDNPLWGSHETTFGRFQPYSYSDGIQSPRVASSGRELPSPRLISAAAHQDVNRHEHSISILLVAWGQFVDHDITLTAETDDIKCCRGINVTNPSCMPIQIPADDHFYSIHQQTCINFVRSRAGLRNECKLGPREQVNEVSSVIDANTVYSNDPEKIRKLRSYEGGRLKSLPIFQDVGMKDMLPLNLENPDRGCIRPSRDVFCFLAGDARASEQTVLALIHTLFLREHNRIADELYAINPHWSDETIFQETRHIVAAINQHITYNEFLPLILGKKGLYDNKLTLYSSGYYDGYDASLNPAAASGFTTAAFRFGHSLLPSTIERWSRSHQYIGNQKLSEMLQQPYDLFKAGWADQYLLGMLNQVAQAMDDSITDQVTNHLFAKPGQGFGMDLAAINMQRGREHGVASYNRYREWCGLKPLYSWADMAGVMQNASASAYPSLYESPEDIDLWSGGVSEIPAEGSLLGPTFSCIIGRQFFNLRAGDRFWYENPGWPSSFTVEQLASIRQVSLSRLICDNTDDMETIQLRAMLLPDHKLNPRLSCASAEIPRLNLGPWRDAGSAF